MSDTMVKNSKGYDYDKSFNNNSSNNKDTNIKSNNNYINKKSSKSYNKKTKKTSIVDKYLGIMIRRKRIIQGYSQIRLAEQAGITFQQLQKYETGTNRIPISRLYTMAKVLNIKVEEFFIGLEKFLVKCDKNGDLGAVEYLKRIKNNRNINMELVNLNREFVKIKNNGVRKLFINFIKEMNRCLG